MVISILYHCNGGRKNRNKVAMFTCNMDLGPLHVGCKIRSANVKTKKTSFLKHIDFFCKHPVQKDCPCVHNKHHQSVYKELGS
jgi:hypothetical protein